MDSTPKPRQRIWELDAWRGAIIVYMLFFHFMYDMHFFYGHPFNPFERLGFATPFLISITFYPLAGITTGLSRHTFKNGLRVAALALIFFVVSWFLFPDMFVRFGTLHLLATAMLLTPLLNRLPTWLLSTLVPVFYLLGQMAHRTLVTNPWLFPFGLMTIDFTSLDYFPIFPYLGPYIAGMVFYRLVYARRGKTSLLPEWRWTRPLQFVGRHSLMIYVLHQPVYMVLLFLTLGKPAFMN